MATSLDVSKYIVRFFQERGDLITNLKLQKLLYYVQGWSLALRGKAAFAESTAIITEQSMKDFFRNQAGNE